MAVAYLLASLAIGFLLARHYGQGWDDAWEAFYGRVVSRAYGGDKEYYLYSFQSNFGPGYQLLQYHATILLQRVLRSWSPVHLRYLSNFLVFQVGVVSLFWLARRWFSRATSIVGVLLFLTQPLLFGHAFINHKDGVFTSLFTASVASGIAFVDHLSNYSTEHKQNGRPGSAFAAAGTVALLLLVGALILDAGFFTEVSALAARTASQAYAGTAVAPLNALFAAIAENRSSIGEALYASKAALLAWKIEVALAAAVLISLVVLLKQAVPAPRRRALAILFGSLVLASGFLGFATSTRIAGPFAGLLVLAYAALIRPKPRVWPFLAVYALTAYAVTFALWPALWTDPIGQPLQALGVFSNFPSHDVLFQGRVFSSLDLPASFLPTLFVRQITETALGLIALGLVVLVARIGRTGQRPGDAMIVAMWFLVPFAAVVFLGLPNYNGFRHYLFILPPLFLLPGLPLEAIQHRMQGWRPFAALSGALLLPGVAGILLLHPYEYIYFNTVSGGVTRASGRYELDYWCLAYAEATARLNEIAPEGATVVVWGPVQAAKTFARADLLLVGEGQVSESPHYALACAGAVSNPSFYATFPVLDRIDVAGATIALIKVNPEIGPIQGQSLEDPPIPSAPDGSATDDAASQLGE